MPNGSASPPKRLRLDELMTEEACMSDNDTCDPSICEATYPCSETNTSISNDAQVFEVCNIGPMDPADASDAEYFEDLDQSHALEDFKEVSDTGPTYLIDGSEAEHVENLDQSNTLDGFKQMCDTDPTCPFNTNDAEYVEVSSQLDVSNTSSSLASDKNVPSHLNLSEVDLDFSHVSFIPDDYLKDSMDNVSTLSTGHEIAKEHKNSSDLCCNRGMQASTPMKLPPQTCYLPIDDISPIKLDLSGGACANTSRHFDKSVSDLQYCSVFRASECENIYAEEISDCHSACVLSESAYGNETVAACDNDNEAGVRSGSSEALARATLLNSVKLHSESELSVNEGILSIMELNLKNRQSKKALHRAVKTILKLLPKDNNLPSSSKKILSYVKSLAPPTNTSKHYYCEVCLLYRGTSVIGHCEACKEATDFGCFYSFDVAESLKFLFENRNLAILMDQTPPSSSGPGIFKDLKDGAVYKSLNRDRKKYDVNLIVGSDGVKIRKSSRYELWLLLCTIVEVPIYLQRAYMTVLGVWYDKKKPDMRTFLKPFSEQMKELDEVGFKWKHPVSKEVHSSFVRMPVVVCDAPARSMVQNAMLFNSKYGCQLCEIKTKRTAQVEDQKRIRVYFYEKNVTMRTERRILQQAKAAEREQVEHKKGIKGPSPLSIIPSVDIAKCLVPEYMHSCCLGVVKQLLNIWFQKPGPWSIAKRVSEIDVQMSRLKLPDFVHRSKRQLSSLKFWKASDFYYFLILESLPVLKGHLPERYYQHYILLVKAVYTLLKSPLLEQDRQKSDLLLLLFCNEFEGLYGDRELTYNVHQLSHYGDCVLWYGPLYTCSAFSFEDLNGVLGKSTHGSNKVDAEIINNVKIGQGIQVLKIIVQGLSECVSRNHCDLQGEFLGNEVPVKLSEDELNLIGGECVKVFERAKLGLDVFTSMIYKKLKSENYHILFSDVGGFDKYGCIKYYVSTSTDMFVVIQLYSVDLTQVFCHTETMECIDHLVPVNLSDKCVAIKVCDLIKSIVKVGKISNFIVKRPNLYRFVF